MSEDEVRCPYCGSSDYVQGEFSDDPLICNSCGKPFIHVTSEMNRQYEEACRCGYRDIPIREIPGGGMISQRVYEPVRPLPCVRDEHGEIKEQPVYRLWGKVDEELDELKQALFLSKYFSNMHEYVAEKAADVKTAITTLEEALGIDAAMRDEAIRQVNHKNFSRGRL